MWTLTANCVLDMALIICIMSKKFEWLHSWYFFPFVIFHFEKNCNFAIQAFLFYCLTDRHIFQQIAQRHATWLASQFQFNIHRYYVFSNLALYQSQLHLFWPIILRITYKIYSISTFSNMNFVNLYLDLPWYIYLIIYLVY